MIRPGDSAAIVPPLDARSIKQALDLPSLVRERYGLRLRRAGRQNVSLCCFHSERHPSLYIDRDRFHCFGCGIGGDSLRFVMLAENIDFLAALRVAADFIKRFPGVGAASEPRSGERFGRAEGAKPLSPRSGRPSIASPTRALWEGHRRAAEEGARRSLEARSAELPASMRALLLDTEN